MNVLIFCSKSVYGILNSLVARSKAKLDAESTFSFLFTPMWLCIQHQIISFQFDIDSTLLNSLIINGSQVLYYLMIVRPKASMRILKRFLCLFFEMISRWYRNDIESLFYCTGFYCEGKSFRWRSFLDNCLIQNSCACRFVIVLGDIHEGI